MLWVGMLAVLRDSSGGFRAGLGLGLTAIEALSICPRLRAAIRACMDCCWGSASLIVKSYHCKSGAERSLVSSAGKKYCNKVN